MDSNTIKLYLERAQNEILTAETLKQISEEKDTKKELDLPPDVTFYSAVISHAYYAIFYSTKAILLTKGITTTYPDVHKKTYDTLEKEFVNTGILDKHLLEIYQDLAVKASDLLDIFKEEKWKRGHFTYQLIPQANKRPAEESLNNAKLFVASIKTILLEEL